MAPLRKPLQGVGNIVRFNWHFYAIAGGLALILGVVGAWVPGVRGYVGLALALLLGPLVLSLVVSAYVYDFSGLYGLQWLPAPGPTPPAVLTVSAGFDEISAIVQQRYAPRQLLALDFYNPARHTEVSIKRARRAYPPFPGTQPADTRAALPLSPNRFDLTFAFLAAHEIREAEERADFFRELGRVTKPEGTIIVTEHLRDPANFLAYNIGFLHFHSRRTWLDTFRRAGLHVAREIKVTPFITSFLLRPHGTAA